MFKAIALITILLTSATAILPHGQSQSRHASTRLADFSQGIGQAGVNKFYDQHRAELSSPRDRKNEKQNQIHAKLDQLCRQKDCYTSRLFWHTDLSEAQAQAEREGKPILSLHLLGLLTDEYSCANSRFFRAALYADPEISDYLRKNYVLHWTSVRPVPKVTVDYGDGRKLERTITGNSIHYILSADGRPVDGLPGLYGPKRFLAELNETVRARAWESGISDKERDKRIAAQPAYASDSLLTSATLNFEKRLDWTLSNSVEAQMKSLSKVFTEGPVMRRARLLRGPSDMEGLEAAEAAAKLPHRSRLVAGGAGFAERLSHSSRKFMREQIGRDATAGMVEAFEMSITRDGYLNERNLRQQVRDMIKFDRENGRMGLEYVNRLVYENVFNTPAADKWMGLYPTDVYVGLNQNGVVDIAKN